MVYSSIVGWTIAILCLSWIGYNECPRHYNANFSSVKIRKVEAEPDDDPWQIRDKLPTHSFDDDSYYDAFKNMKYTKTDLPDLGGTKLTFVFEYSKIYQQYGRIMSIVDKYASEQQKKAKGPRKSRNLLQLFNRFKRG